MTKIKAIEQYFQVVLFIMVNNVVENFNFMFKSHSFESYWTVLSSNAIGMLIKRETLIREHLIVTWSASHATHSHTTLAVLFLVPREPFKVDLCKMNWKKK